MQAINVDSPTSVVTSSDVDIVAQAGAVATGAVRVILTGALRSATACRCHNCRAQAAATYDWATTFLRVEPKGRYSFTPPSPSPLSL
jgi:hypothetical protein